MTFEERCERFVRNSEKEHNKFKFVYRVIFLNKKIKEYEAEESLFSTSKKRVGELSEYKKMI